MPLGLARLSLLRFIDEHHGNAIPNGIAPSARIADDPVSLEVNGGLASRAREDLEKILVDQGSSSAERLR